MTTNFITKEHFVGLINSLQAQYQKDKECANKIGQIFNSESPGPYDNTILIDAIVSCLRKYFPQEDGHCEIMHYCYELNFGKNGDDYESPAELYDRLVASLEDKNLFCDRLRDLKACFPNSSEILVSCNVKDLPSVKDFDSLKFGELVTGAFVNFEPKIGAHSIQYMGVKFHFMSTFELYKMVSEIEPSQKA